MATRHASVTKGGGIVIGDRNRLLRPICVSLYSFWARMYNVAIVKR